MKMIAYATLCQHYRVMLLYVSMNAYNRPSIQTTDAAWMGASNEGYDRFYWLCVVADVGAGADCRAGRRRGREDWLCGAAYRAVGGRRQGNGKCRAAGGRRCEFTPSDAQGKGRSIRTRAA